MSTKEGWAVTSQNFGWYQSILALSPAHLLGGSLRQTHLKSLTSRNMQGSFVGRGLTRSSPSTPNPSHVLLPGVDPGHKQKGTDPVYIRLQCFSQARLGGCCLALRRSPHFPQVLKETPQKKNWETCFHLRGYL